MLFSSRIGLRELAQLCRRLSTGLEAGVDVRRVWTREKEGYVSPTLRRHFDQMVEAVNRGETISDALADTGSYFPPLFRELVNVGEQTGKLAEVLRRLAEHYEHQVRLRQAFMAAIAWPMLQLAAAVGIIGLVIYVMGFMPKMADGKPLDILGFGLVGGEGLVKYLLIIGGIVAAITAVVQAIRRGLAWTRPIQLLLIRLPGLGKPIETLALAQFSWTMYVTLEAGMDLLKAIPLCLRSTGNAHYTDHTTEIVQEIRHGGEITRALADTKAFPRTFLDSIHVGEESGRLPETLAILSEQYQDQAKRAMAALTVVGGFLVWGLVAMVIIAFIFRIASMYIGTINSALEM
ncbi:MAG TPA: type II secretion system F family protein [Pirellulales bacterium]|jgi:type IV pilus assembly protein PilC|nr:type II secretion system F family protein [Pirellulales bacterium]